MSCYPQIGSLIDQAVPTAMVFDELTPDQVKHIEFTYLKFRSLFLAQI